MFETIIGKINGAKSIQLFTHMNMDGDAMGSTMALCRVIRKLGKDCRIIVEDAVPRYLSFMDDGSFFVNVDDYLKANESAADLAIALDIGYEKKLGARVAAYRSARDNCCIDHHRPIPGEKPLSNVEVRDPSAAATCILIQEMIEEMEQQGGKFMDKDIAENLYVGTVTDTGSFRYADTDSRAHMTVARLFEHKIEHNRIYTNIYGSYPLAQLKMEALAIERAEVFCGGKACISWACTSDLEDIGAEFSMSETCVERLRIIDGVEISCFAMQKPDGSFKVNMRSKLYADSGAICAIFGGGGHKMASNCIISCSLEEMIPRLKTEIEKELAKSNV